MAFRDVIRPGESRGLDFVSIPALNRRTGIDHDVLLFAMKEITCNALDKPDATEIIEKVERDSQFDWLIIKDNGSQKLSRADLNLILDFDHPASSKRGLHQVSRGYLGNALKCIFGYTYALSEDREIEPPSIFIVSGEFEWQIKLKPDEIEQEINHEIYEVKRTDDGFTSFKVAFPCERIVEQSKGMLHDILLGTYMVNLQRKITYDFYGETGILGKGETSSELPRETSALWYNLNQFTDLFHDYQRASPNEPVRKLVAIFRGFSGYNAQQEVFERTSALQQEEGISLTKNCNANLHSKNGEMQFLPNTPLRDFTDYAIAQLFTVLKARSKPISKRTIKDVLGCVEEVAFNRLKEENRWLTRKRGNYVMLKGTTELCPAWRYQRGEINHVEYPYLIELAVFDRPEDGKGRQVFQCVNFMASTHDVLSQMFNVSDRLGSAGVKQSTPVTIIVHVVCPVLGWLNDGKTTLSDIDSLGLLEKAFDKLLPVQREPYHYVPPRPYSWIPKGNFYDPIYRDRLRIFAQEILAIARKSSFHIPPRMRGWGYRLEQLSKIDKGQFDALAVAINDCRNLGEKNGGLPMDIISPDPDESRHFKGIHRATSPKVTLEQFRNSTMEMLGSLPAIMTDFYESEQYYLMMVVEKGEVLNLFGPICEEYGSIPYVSSKGWSNLEIRYSIAQQCKWAAAHGLKPVLLCFYDMDPKGEQIPEIFRKHLKKMEPASGWNPDTMDIVRFGLTEDQIREHELSWVDNLKTSSGKEAKRTKSVLAYIERHHGERKCEMESLYKDDKTTRAAEQICRKAIEDFLGKDAKERFRKKIEESKIKLETLYGNPLWKQFDDGLAKIVETLPEELKTEPAIMSSQEQEVEVLVDNKYYGKCPTCGKQFNYDVKKDIGKLLVCRGCGLQMRIQLA